MLWFALPLSRGFVVFCFSFYSLCFVPVVRRMVYARFLFRQTRASSDPSIVEAELACTAHGEYVV